MCRGFNFPPKHCHIIVPVICTHCPPPTYGEGWGIAPEEAWIQMTGALNMNVTGVTAKLICTFVFDILHIQNVGFLMMQLTSRTSNLRINHAELRTTSAEFRIIYAEFRKNMRNISIFCAEFRMNMRNSAEVSQYAELLPHLSSETFLHQQRKNRT